MGKRNSIFVLTIILLLFASSVIAGKRKRFQTAFECFLTVSRLNVSDNMGGVIPGTAPLCICKYKEDMMIVQKEVCSDILSTADLNSKGKKEYERK